MPLLIMASFIKSRDCEGYSACSGLKGDAFFKVGACFDKLGCILRDKKAERIPCDLRSTRNYACRISDARDLYYYVNIELRNRDRRCGVGLKIIRDRNNTVSKLGIGKGIA